MFFISTSWNREEIDQLRTPASPKKHDHHQSRKRIESKRKKAAKKEHQRLSTIEDIAREAALFDCKCKNACLASVGDSVAESIRMLTDYITPWINMTNKEHKAKFFPILEGCAHGVSPGGHLNKR